VLIACLIVINALLNQYVTNVMNNSTGGLMKEFVKHLMNVVLMFMNTGLKKDNKSAYIAQMLLIAVTDAQMILFVMNVMLNSTGGLMKLNANNS
jgi:hypothetical protein